MNTRQLKSEDAEIYLTARRRGLLPAAPRPSGWRMFALFLMRPVHVLRLAAQRRRAEARADESVRAFLKTRNIS